MAILSAGPRSGGARRRHLWVAAAFAAAITSIAGRGGAVVPGGNGLIAFTSTVAGNADIAALDPCAAVREIIEGPDAELRPVWSPDGRRIAFMSNRDGDFEIYVANADGSGIQADGSARERLQSRLVSERAQDRLEQRSHRRLRGLRHAFRWHSRA
jgi:WD40-like Beta Propeller Repeat